MHKRRDRSVVSKRGSRARGFVSMDDVALLSEGAIGDERAAFRVRDLRIASAWRRAVGHRLALVTELHACRRGKVTVHVYDQSWKRALEQLKPLILDRMRNILPGERIDSLTLHVAPYSTMPMSMGLGAESRATTEQTSHGLAAGGRIDVSIDLQKRLVQVASRYLTRAREREARESRTG